MDPTDRNEARREIESRLGPEGSRELAEAVMRHLDRALRVNWHHAPRYVAELSDVEFNEILDAAQADLEGAK